MFVNRFTELYLAHQAKTSAAKKKKISDRVHAEKEQARLQFRQEQAAKVAQAHPSVLELSGFGLDGSRWDETEL